MILTSRLMELPKCHGCGCAITTRNRTTGLSAHICSHSCHVWNVATIAVFPLRGSIDRWIRAEKGTIVNPFLPLQRGEWNKHFSNSFLCTHTSSDDDDDELMALPRPPFTWIRWNHFTGTAPTALCSSRAQSWIMILARASFRRQKQQRHFQCTG